MVGASWRHNTTEDLWQQVEYLALSLQMQTVGHGGRLKMEASEFRSLLLI